MSAAQPPSEILLNLSTSQTEELRKALTETLRTIVGKECAFVLGFMPIDDTRSAQTTALACATNLAPADALIVAGDVVAHLKTWERIESQPMTRN